MSCYFRHLKDIFKEAGIEVTPESKKRVDQAIHQIAGTTYKDCPQALKWLKQQLGDEQKRQELISQLKSAL